MQTAIEVIRLRSTRIQERRHTITIDNIERYETERRLYRLNQLNSLALIQRLAGGATAA